MMLIIINTIDNKQQKYHIYGQTELVNLLEKLENMKEIFQSGSVEYNDSIEPPKTKMVQHEYNSFNDFISFLHGCWGNQNYFKEEI